MYLGVESCNSHLYVDNTNFLCQNEVKDVYFHHFQPDNENNNGSPPSVSDGIIVSHVLENGSAEKNGLQIYDQILKVCSACFSMLIDLNCVCHDV